VPGAQVQKFDELNPRLLLLDFPQHLPAARVGRLINSSRAPLPNKMK
jgi:hypothetical protein